MDREQSHKTQVDQPKKKIKTRIQSIYTIYTVHASSIFGKRSGGCGPTYQEAHLQTTEEQVHSLND